jgi:hypothetical protein
MRLVSEIVAGMFDRGDMPSVIAWVPGRAPAGTVDSVATWDDAVRGYVFVGPHGPAVIPAFLARERWGVFFQPVVEVQHAG